MSIRKLTLTGLMTVGVWGIGLLFTGSLALATQVLAGQPFGSFTYPTGVAVDQANGNVYVADGGGAEVVQVFGGSGELSPASGLPHELTGVDTPAGGFAFSFEPAGVAVDSACTIEKLSGAACAAFDPANGDIYVTDVRHNVVDKFRQSGGKYEFVCEFAGFTAPENGEATACQPTGEPGEVPFAEPVGVAVDAHGNVYVANYSPGLIYEFDAAGKAVRAIGSALVGVPEGIAVDRHGDVFVQGYNSHTLAELKRGSLTGPVESEEQLAEGVSGIAEDLATGRLLVGFGSSVTEYNEAHEVQREFGSGIVGGVAGVAVGEAGGQVYVSGGVTTLFQLVTTGPPAVDDPPPAVSSVTRTRVLLGGAIEAKGLATQYHYEYVDAADYDPAAADPYELGATTPGMNAGAGGGDKQLPVEPIEGLLAGTTYHYALVASNAEGTTVGPDYTFTTAAATPPVLTTGAAQSVSQNAASISATIDTRGLATNYGFEIGTSTDYGPPTGLGAVGAGASEAVVTLGLTGLAPGTTYHYRVVASSIDGTTYGADETFTTTVYPSAFATPPAPLPFVAVPAVAFPAGSEANTAQPKRKPRAKSKERDKQKRVRPRGKRSVKPRSEPGRRG
jgi:DNA-binding beta-propeller fold protein YncE